LVTSTVQLSSGSVVPSVIAMNPPLPTITPWSPDEEKSSPRPWALGFWLQSFSGTDHVTPPSVVRITV
jgi:hypothetical protein